MSESNRGVYFENLGKELRELYEKLSPSGIKEDLNRAKKSTLKTGIIFGISDALALVALSYNPGFFVPWFLIHSFGIPYVWLKCGEYWTRSSIAEEYLKKKGGDIPE